jgi:predicted nucleic acid-binding protein
MTDAGQSRRQAHEVVQDIATTIQSDVLAQWHTVLRELPGLAMVLGVPNQLHLVIDANVVIAEVRWMVKKRSKQNARTALQEVIASGTVIAYAPPVLRFEVEKRLRTIAESDGLPLEQFLEAWASYEPLLCFVEPPSLRDAARQAAARDPNDAPYFELQVGIDAVAVYTDDPDLRAMGAPVVNRPALKAARDFARAASISFTFRISGTIVLAAGIAFLHFALVTLRGGLRAARRLPDWVQALLVVAVCILVVNPRSRAWMLDRLRTMGSHALSAARELMPLVVTAMEQTTIATATAQNAWAEVVAGLPERSGLASQPLHVHVLTACVRAGAPLTTDEIVQAVGRQGFRGGAAPSRGYLQRVLRSHSALIRTADMRWQTRAV